MKSFNKTFLSFIFVSLFAVGFLGYKNNPENTVNPVEYVLSQIENVSAKPEGTFDRAWRIIKNNYIDKTYNHQDWERWLARYDNRIKTNNDTHVAIETMVESLNDPYSRFLSPEEFAEQDRNIDAKVIGIGVYIASIKGNTIIANVIEGSPAEKSGLKPEDRILSVNGKSVKGISLNKIAEMVRGKEGTTVKITILREKTQIEKNIIRKEVKIKSVKYSILKNNYAYIRLSTFISNDAAYEMVEALEKTKNTKGIILDLRGNHGGLLPNAVLISNMFISKGNIVSIVDRNGKSQDYNAEPDRLITQKPMVVLIDNESASASEILSGALKDHKRAELIGEKTFGKGLVQRILKLPDGSGINLTIAKYLTPNGHDIGHKGIEPDYKVVMTEKHFIAKKDAQLEKAKQILASKIYLNERVASGKKNTVKYKAN